MVAIIRLSTVYRFAKRTVQKHYRKYKKQVSEKHNNKCVSVNKSQAVSDGELNMSARGHGGSSTSLPGCPAAAAAAGEAGGQRQANDVLSWAVCFEKLLEDPVGVRYFTAFLKSEVSEENILFWQACEKFKKIPAKSLGKLKEEAASVYNTYLSDSAPYSVNIDDTARIEKQDLQQPTPTMFDKAQTQIFKLMKMDSYRRFVRSPLYQSCTVASVAGKPLPALHSSKPTSKGSWEDMFTNGRSSPCSPEHGGGSHPGLEGGYCCVYLPDGSASLAPTRPGMLLRDMLASLCEKRGFPLKDVIIYLRGKDKQPLSLEQDCMVVRDKEVDLELRVTIALEVVFTGRTMGIVVKSSKKLQDALAVVLQKHQLRPQDAIVTMVGCPDPISMGTNVFKLANKTLQLDKIKGPRLVGHTSTAQDRGSTAGGAEIQPHPSESVRAHNQPKPILLDMLSKAQFRADDQRGLLTKEHLELPEFLQLPSDPVDPESASGGDGSAPGGSPPPPPPATTPTTTCTHTTEEEASSSAEGASGAASSSKRDVKETTL